MNDDADDTTSAEYTDYLVGMQEQRLKRLIEPVNPYRWNIRRLCKGRVLDVGCGIGRNLRYLNRPDAVGVDHNEHSVAVVNAAGGHACVPDTFHRDFGADREQFDTIVIAHVLEHLEMPDANGLLEEYLPYLKKGGRVVVMCPQERGFAADVTHITYFDTKGLTDLLEDKGLKVTKAASFPFPAFMGGLFIYNEHVVVAVKSE